MEKYYGEIPPGPPIAKQEAWIAKRTGTHRGIVQDRVPQARLYRVWNVPQAFSPKNHSSTLPGEFWEVARPRGYTSGWFTTIRLPRARRRASDNSEIGGQFIIAAHRETGARIWKRWKPRSNEELREFPEGWSGRQAELELDKDAE